MYEKELAALESRRQEIIEKYADMPMSEVEGDSAQAVAFRREFRIWRRDNAVIGAELKRRADCGVYDMSVLGVGVL